MVVEGVEVDLRGMEWFMESLVDMLAMQDYMKEFVEEFKHTVVQPQQYKMCPIFKVDVQTDWFFFS